MTARAAKVLLLVASVILVIGVAAVVRHKLAPKHFVTVEDGVLYRSGRLRPSNLEAVLDRYGIRTVVNLRTPAENAAGDWHAKQGNICQARGARLVDLPVDFETPPDATTLVRWLALMNDPANHPVLVHCKHGVVRTGMMVAAYQMQSRQEPPLMVWEELPRFGHNLDAARRHAVREFVLSFSPPVVDG